MDKLNKGEDPNGVTSELVYAFPGFNEKQAIALDLAAFQMANTFLVAAMGHDSIRSQPAVRTILASLSNFEAEDFMGEEGEKAKRILLLPGAGRFLEASRTVIMMTATALQMHEEQP